MNLAAFNPELADQTNSITFRFYGYYASNSAGTWQIKNHVTEGGLVFGGEIAPVTANEAPSDISLSSSTVAENEPVGTTVGALATTDPDTGNTFTYTLVAGTGGDDNASFSIDGSNLLTAASFDYETKSSYTVRVRTTDQGGLWYEEAFAITVTDVNELAPTLQAPELRADGEVVLRWTSIPNHMYTVHHSTNLLSGFTVLESNLVSTPPMNAYTDTVNGVNVKFWKVSTGE